jgi:hypothetical protein
MELHCFVDDISVSVVLLRAAIPELTALRPLKCHGQPYKYTDGTGDRLKWQDDHGAFIGSLCRPFHSIPFHSIPFHSALLFDLLPVSPKVVVGGKRVEVVITRSPAVHVQCCTPP